MYQMTCVENSGRWNGNNARSDEVLSETDCIDLLLLPFPPHRKW